MQKARQRSNFLQTSLLRIAFPRFGEEHTSNWMVVGSVGCVWESFQAASESFFFGFSFGGGPFEANTPILKPSRCRGASASESQTSHHDRSLVSVAFGSAESHYHNNHAICGLALPPSASRGAKDDVRRQSRSVASGPLASGRVVHEDTRPSVALFVHNTIVVCARWTE
jgi:hypothetical protein